MKKIVVLVAALSLAACSKDDGGSKSGQKPSVLNHPIVSAQKLNDNQKEEIHSLMSKNQLAPDLHLILAPADDGQDSKARKEKQIKEMSPEKKKIYDQILADCKVDSPATVKSGELNEAGSKQISDFLGTLSGEKCPVAASKQDHSETTVVESNMKALQDEYQRTGDASVFQRFAAKYNISDRQETSNKILDPQLQAQLGQKEQSSVMESSGSASTVGIDGKGGDTSFVSKGTLSLVTLNDQKVTAEIQLEIARSNGKQELYMEANFKFPSSNAVVQAFLDKDGGKKYFLNGEEMTEDQMKKIFGDNFSVQAND